MWNWIYKIFNEFVIGKPKELPEPIAERSSEHPYRTSSSVDGTTPPVHMDEFKDCISETPQLIFKKPNLHAMLAKARQEALDPVLPESMKEAVEIGVNTVLPATFKKALISREDLILFGSSDIASVLKERISEEDWNIIKCFIIKRLNDEGIKATNSSTGSFVLCHCKDVLDSIRDYK